MRKLMIICILGLTMAACQGPGGDKAEVSQAKEKATASEQADNFVIDTDRSIITWVGSKPAGRHNGTINLSEGTISVEGGTVSAGSFTIDMKTVTARDEAMDEEKNGQLTGHLKSADFFDVYNYPASAFEIVSVEDIAAHDSGEDLKLEGATHFVTGNLTMKDSTKAVKFPAVIHVDDAAVTAKALFYIDRTDWGMHYKSDKAFGDQIIHARVEVGFDITAN
jgi:polyisoprenoid-binding protein YceI